MPAFRILHTADWHLGARLHEEDRSEEHRAFLDWLLELLAGEKVDLLIVSGDVFDTAVPKQQTTALYYQFLTKLATLGHVEAVLTGGNHDSPLHLDAPREILEQLKIHVFGSLPRTLGDALLEFPNVTVAAIPFLREVDLVPHMPPENGESHAARIREAIANVYAEVKRQAPATGKPLLAMGHLTAAGATLLPDSERDIHVGNQAAVGPEMFHGFDYVALGHLHSYQSVASQDHIRYSGSPIALSFSEAGREKWVILLTVEENGNITQQRHAVPQPRQLVQHKGTYEELLQLLQALECPDGYEPWLELVLLEPISAVQQQNLREALSGKGKILKFTAKFAPAEASGLQVPEKTLAELSEREVFENRVSQLFPDDNDVERRERLHVIFGKLLEQYHESTFS
jgi:DNA repair protein SbcD/Mre11